MAKIKSTIGKALYKVEIVSPSGNILIADEPLENGGQNSGFSPKELLASSLAACTSATLMMYANHKGMDLQTVIIDIDLERDEDANKTIIHRKIELNGNLSEEQKARLLVVANKCPVHKILSNPIEINTTFD